MDKLIKTVELTLTNEERTKEGKALLKLVMSHWINAADCILEMMVIHLPSPKVA